MAYLMKVERDALNKGVVQGEQLGEAKMLLRQLERRFGPPSKERREEVLSADTETLLRWSDRILDAKTPDEIFH